MPRLCDEVGTTLPLKLARLRPPCSRLTRIRPPKIQTFTEVTKGRLPVRLGANFKMAALIPTPLRVLFPGPLSKLIMCLALLTPTRLNLEVRPQFTGIIDRATLVPAVWRCLINRSQLTWQRRLLERTKKLLIP